MSPPREDREDQAHKSAKGRSKRRKVSKNVKASLIGIVHTVMPYRTQMESRCFRSHEYAWIGERSRDFADHTPGQDLKWSSLLPSKPLFISGEIMTKRECWKPFFFKFKSFLEWGSWWSLLPLGPNWHLQLLQLLFRYIEAGGIPSILIHYIALLFSTTICWCPLPFW